MKNFAPGFLIAMPQLGDPNFHRSVILILEHGEAGSMGLVINRLAPLSLKDVAEGQSLKISAERENERVFLGGPVEQQRGFVLHDREDLPEKHPVAPGLFLSVTKDSLEPILCDPTAKLRFCLGYSGWGPHQLEREMAVGSWLFTEAAAAATLDTAPEDLWNITLRGMGVDPAMLVPSKGVN